MKKSEFEATNLVVFIYKWRKPLIAISLAAAIVSAGVSLILREKYLSTVILFPANTSSISKSVMTEDVTGKNDIVAFGEEEQAEQFLQILYSDKIKSTLRDKYNLMKHYRINPKDDKYPITTFNKMWDANVTFKRTEFMSIRIDVLAFDKDTAALIANDIAEMVDEMKNSMQQNRANEALRVIESEYFKMLGYMKVVDDSLTYMRKKGVHEFETQIEMLSAEYYKAVSQGNTRAEKDLQAKLDTMAKYGSAFLALTDGSEWERERLIMLRAKYEETLVDATQSIPHKFIVNKAYPAEKKAYPIRWLIVVVSTLSAFVVTLLGIIGIENYKKLTSLEQ